LMVESFELRAASVTVDDRHQPMIGTRTQLAGEGVARRTGEGGNSQLLSPKFWLLAPDTCQSSR
jgi:hypothetical protein